MLWRAGMITYTLIYKGRAKMNRIQKTSAAIALLGACAGLVNAETFVVELDGPSFVYNGFTDMNIELFVAVGDTVRWEWTSGFHNVVNGFPGDPDENTLFNSGAPTSDPLTFFEYTFDDAGVFGYHCEVHEDIGMISFVTVVPAPSTMMALAPVGLMLTRRRR
ncbi:hypothetical protein COB72_11250 [bacterium]|nr:MAG: hypothetical protein COB72_11250 [bacterium]